MAIWFFVKNNWHIISGISLGVFSICKHFAARERELAWRRTEFIFKEAKILDSDSELSEAIRVLEGRHPDFNLKRLYENYKEKQGSDERKFHEKFDRLLNFFDRLAYATFHAKTLSIPEVSIFGWYLRKIEEDPYLSAYCLQFGFRDVIKLSKKVRKWHGEEKPDRQGKSKSKKNN